MAKNDATTNDEAGKAAVAGKAGESTKAEPLKVEPPGAADTAGTGQPNAPASAPDIATSATSAGAPGAAAQPADGVTQENTSRRPVAPVAIEVISRVEGFWRGDRQWTIAPQTVPLPELTGGQLDEIKGEPLLIVRDVFEGEH